jgi:energy-coupling factor transporter ATP-binding protein EcfA2
MPLRVSKLTMAGFRGATAPATIEFDTSKPVVLIFGENGTGKSTIADAFDFLCNRSFGSLENYSLGEPAKNHVASFGRGPADVSVILESGANKWQATMGKAGPAVRPSVGHPDAQVLRRRKILSLIEAQPKQRFEVLKEFIAVPSIEKCEGTLRDAVNATNNSVGELVRSIDQANYDLERLWTAEGAPGASAIAWATTEAEKDVSKLQETITQIAQLLSSYQAVESALATLDRALADQSAASEALASAQSRQVQAESKERKQSGKLLSVLREAEAYVSGRTTLSQCPVCEQSVDSSELARRLGARIAAMQEIASIASETSAAQLRADATRTLFDQARNDFGQKGSRLADGVKTCALSELTLLNLDWSRFDALVAMSLEFGALDMLAREFWGIVLAAREALQRRHDADQKSLHQHNAIAGYVETLRDKRALALAQQTLLVDLRSALEIVMQQRKGYIEEILASISIEVEALYLKLHPGEGIGRVRFYLNPRTIGSLEFDAQFQDAVRLPPQAYYSESHLDTLGICVFLALAKYFKTDHTIVVLDDVLTSVDGPHLDRFMALLHDQAQQFGQVIITTHYRPWRDRYRWARGSTANTQVIELGPWSLENGLQTGEFLTAIEELKGSLAKVPFDRQGAASKGGIVLESLLDFITLKYHCKTPRNARNEYTLGDLVGAVDSALGKVLHCRKPTAAGGPKVDALLKPLLEAATANQWVRNSVGCHFNPLGSEVCDIEVRDFCQNVLTLTSHLICGKCETLPTRRPSGSYWECQCGELELYPLIYPGADPKTVDQDES